MHDVEMIYQAYPRHKDKIHALASIEKAVRRVMNGEAGSKCTRMWAVDYLLERAKAFAQSPAGNRGTMTAFPATWFNRGSYLDDPQEWDYITPDEEKRLSRSSEANVGVWRPQ